MRRIKSCRFVSCVFVSGLLALAAGGAQAQGVVLNEAEFRDKVLACWLGKNIGGTLGMPFEGKTDVNDLTFYTNLKEGEPAANDDLDLQILWLKAMEENQARVDAYTLGQYWLKYVPVDWNEYGIGKANLARGLMPPLSGEFGNAKWKHSRGRTTPARPGQGSAPGDLGALTLPRRPAAGRSRAGPRLPHGSADAHRHTQGAHGQHQEHRRQGQESQRGCARRSAGLGPNRLARRGFRRGSRTAAHHPAVTARREDGARFLAPRSRPHVRVSQSLHAAGPGPGAGGSAHDPSWQRGDLR
jgi:hypothetical protein